jgi:hypothetical protein
MRRFLGVFLVLAVLAGCGPSATIDKLASDLSGKDPILQVWCHAKSLREGDDYRVNVEWNKNVGTASVDWNSPHEDNFCLVQVQQWSIGNSTWDRLNEMNVHFLCNQKEIAHRVLKTPTDFANAFNERK